MPKPVARPVLVIAVHEENADWINDTPEPWVPWVIRKGVDIPNEGREPATFLWAIDQAWDELPDKLAFVQGDPFDHCPDLFDQLKSVDRFKPLGHERFTTYADGSPTHPGLPVKEKYEEWVGGWPGRVDFTRGGQFALTKEDIKKHPRAFYQKLHKQTLEGEIPWVCERLWGSLFSETSRKLPSPQ